MRQLSVLFFYCFITVSVLSNETTETQSLCDSPVVGGHTGAPGETSCNGCHSGAVNTGGAVVDFDFGTTTYVPGHTYTGTVRIQQSGLDKYGFSCLALRNSNNSTVGSFGLVESIRTRTYADGNRNYVSHTPCGADSANANSWTFTWTAPTTDVGTIQLYLGALAANHNHATSGDFSYTKNITLTPQTSSVGQSVESNNFAVYPNPFSGSVTIDGIDAAQPLVVALYDLVGNQVWTRYIPNPMLPLALDFQKGSGLSEGLYNLVIKSDTKSYYRKIWKQ